MISMRPSVAADVPRQRELWKLAFGDSGDYVDNFYHNYYRPDRVVVLEEDGLVQAMTAWFDTTFVLPDGQRHKVGYLYAVATHPDVRGRGFAGMLLKYADDYLKNEHGCVGVTTVPAQPSLHKFFGRHAFRECFIHNQQTVAATKAKELPDFELEPLTPEEYGRLRERLLAGTAHIAFPQDGLEYQAGCSRISGGGFYAARTGEATVILCAEGLGNGELMLKEALGEAAAREKVLCGLHRLLPGFKGVYRCPGAGTAFGMLKWLCPELEQSWDWNNTAYMGFGFD